MTSLLRLEVSCPQLGCRSRSTTSVRPERRAATARPTAPPPITTTPKSAMPKILAGLWPESQGGGAHNVRAASTHTVEPVMRSALPFLALTAVLVSASVQAQPTQGGPLPTPL